jgi:hypothetical protein
MKPNLPPPPFDVFGFRVGMYEECDIDQELIDRYAYARESTLKGFWELFRPPNADEGVPIPGTKGMTLPGDHHRYKLKI